ncbi:ABC transporter ATP-binding protein [Thermincola potens]|uniref:ABC-type quaternary amine transporter n=1 Tax=Thermincola potens (strain JR) TaxID=635013 RepID=D5XFA6_THEPJ|nr:ABC transporter ATP-binding protein [Thermincola potens]ADG82327.1 ABC transporter related protein [Thermincola potens JR]
MKVEIEGISKSFKQNVNFRISAIKSIDLQISEGEFLCILGPSGCGKSTLLNIIAGLEFPDTGQVKVDGQVVREAGPDRGVVFQDAALFPWLTVQENVEFSLKMMGMEKQKRKEIADKYIQMVHLTPFAHCYPHELSGGMKQRVALARTLAMDPTILLMDEPFSALDAQTRTMLHKELQEIWQKTGKAIIFITHNVEESLILADRIILMTARPGQIKRQFVVNHSRPRDLTNPKLIMLQRKIKFFLQEEIEKVAKEQSAYERTHTQVSVLSTAHNNMGTGL